LHGFFELITIFATELLVFNLKNSESIGRTGYIHVKVDG